MNTYPTSTPTPADNAPSGALDVWLRFDSDDDDEAAAEANIWPDGERFRADWYLNAVGLVTSEYFHSYAAAAEWLESVGYRDFSA